MVFLRKSYPILRHPTPTDLFLSLDAHRTLTTPPLKTHVETLRLHSSFLPSGVLLTLSSGKIAPHDRIFAQVFPLNDISIIQLKHS